jgi:hypothetical protein
MNKQCSICECNISRGWFCRKCYELWKDNILSKKQWVRYLQNYESRRRRQPQLQIIYLGDMFDIDNDRNLVIKEGYNYGKT